MRELTLREIQIESLNILSEIDTICRTNGIQYFIIAGTLIGAIRHKGFIPWDDDVDIAMCRDAYDEFLDIYKNTGNYRIVNYETEINCPYMITRISNDRFEQKMEFGPDYKIGAFVDVYPFDGVGNSKTEYKHLCRRSSHYSKCLGRSLEKDPVNNVRKLHRGLKKWLFLPAYIIPKFVGAEYYRRKLLTLKDVYSYKDSIYVGMTVWSQSEKETYKKEWIDELIEVPFENLTVFAPKYYDEMLTKTYGNYMQLPPETERVGHHFYKIYDREK